MEHFSIVLGLCRSAVQSPNPALRGHVVRLQKALKKSGANEEADAVEKVLNAAESSVELAPSRVVLSRAALSGESLTPSVSPPVDKETGAPLAEIVLPTSGGAPAPLFNSSLGAAVDSLLEEWRHVDQLKSAGVRPALSTLLFGAPGTGKTMLAHYIAAQLGLPLIVARLDGLVSSFLGTTARNISTLFAFANRYRCVLLLDEFDAVAKLRDDPHELGEIKRVVNTLLQCIDGRADVGFTLAITNHESLLDPAVWRRFDVRIEVPKPELLTRTRILQGQFQGDSYDEAHFKLLAWLTHDGSGSDIGKLADFLKRQRAIRKDHFSFLEAVRSYVQLSASDDQSKRKVLVVGEQENLARALAADREAPFNQEQLAGLFGCTQPTISRWLKKEKAMQVE
ncbi:AAA family ATPase [Ralstonia wenshanensis]|uniref:AAA family ATPase n=1 Tax=Ralstonia wenshanensis TaxID=2842456 RepID=UPI003D96D1AC